VSEALAEVARTDSAFAPVSSELPPRLEAIGMTKVFGDLIALDNVSFEVKPGTFHALLGENGAGKSTLVKCIMGFYSADQGDILIGEKIVKIGSPRDAQRHEVGMVYQHFTLVENMTVAENLVLSRADIPMIIDWKKEAQAIESFMKTMPFRIAPSRVVRSLAAGEKQKLEILKQLYLGTRVMILDEPTSVLTPQEADEVLGLLKEMTVQGKLSVVIITHRFREVLQFADEVTVLRRGAFAGTGLTKDLTPERMAEMMVGSEPPQASLERREREPASPLLVVKGLEANDELGLRVLNDVSLEVFPGEILGIAGVSGNGQEELVEVLAGQRAATAGTVTVAGELYDGKRVQTMKLGVRLLPETPMRNACVGNMSVAENIGFRCFDTAEFTSARWFVSRGRLRKVARKLIAEYRIKTPGPDAPIGDLSGGNVQRAVLARELNGKVSVLVAANPCFGLDFAAVSEIRTRIMNARNDGAAVLLVSADLEEIFALSDRIVVMSEGRLVYETKAKDANVAEIGRHMAGHHE
jgi:general nucleoside transport system ATP-binding protein